MTDVVSLIRVDDDTPETAILISGDRAYRDDGAGGMVGFGEIVQVAVDRLVPWHTITLRDDGVGWHMVHTIDCDLAACPFDAIAQTWDGPPDDPGVYKWGPNPISLPELMETR